MTYCQLKSHPTDPTLCRCSVCKQEFSIRAIRATGQCLVQPDPRPEEEQAALVKVCKGGCLNYGDKTEGYEMAAVCQLDAPADSKEPCRKKAMVAAYQRRVQFPGDECGKWKEVLQKKSDNSCV